VIFLLKESQLLIVYLLVLMIKSYGLGALELNRIEFIEFVKRWCGGKLVTVHQTTLKCVLRE